MKVKLDTESAGMIARISRLTGMNEAAAICSAVRVLDEALRLKIGMRATVSVPMPDGKKTSFEMCKP